MLKVDNKSAIDLSKNPVHHDRSKHIDTKFHYIRECVDGRRAYFYQGSACGHSDEVLGSRFICSRSCVTEWTSSISSHCVRIRRRMCILVVVSFS